MKKPKKTKSCSTSTMSRSPATLHRSLESARFYSDNEFIPTPLPPAARASVARALQESSAVCVLLDSKLGKCVIEGRAKDGTSFFGCNLDVDSRRLKSSVSSFILGLTGEEKDCTCGACSISTARTSGLGSGSTFYFRRKSNKLYMAHNLCFIRSSWLELYEYR